METAIPAARDINPHNSLDEQHALKNFLGKTLPQAEEMFRDNFLVYQEDLLWMGTKAFNYYVQAAISYLRSDHSNSNSDAANTFCGLMEFRIKYFDPQMAPVLPAICECIGAMLENFDRFECNWKIYCDIAARYEILMTKIKAISLRDAD